MKWFLLIVGSFLGFIPLKVLGQQRSLDLIQAISSDPELRSSWFGISVFSLTKQQTVFEHEAQKAFVPASTLKLLTAAAALETLGPQFQFETKWTCDPISPEGVVQGNIYLWAGADPTLGSTKFPTTQIPLLKQSFMGWIQEKGIRKVRGKFIVCTGKVNNWGPSLGWSWDDLGWYYGAAPSPVCFMDNVVELSLQTLQKQTSPLLVALPAPLSYMTWNNQLIQTAPEVKANVQVLGTNPSTSRTLIGTLPYSPKETKLRLSLPQPALAAGHFFIAALKEQNIAIDSIPKVQEEFPTLGNQTTLGNWRSPILHELLIKVLQDSDNLITEQLATYLGQQHNQTGPEFLTSFWKTRGLDSLGFSLADGSGLSRYNAISPANFTQMLNHVYASKHRNLFMATLPKSGLQGTLQNIGTSKYLKGKVWAKSGSMSKVRGYAGYLFTEQQDTLAFAILWNQFLCPSKKINGQVEAFWTAWRE
jgi:serine-type D-Ala-D-Ala carboxypeptidase/endopeptidase (penicillin-binding protein 4)